MYGKLTPISTALPLSWPQLTLIQRRLPRLKRSWKKITSFITQQF